MSATLSRVFSTDYVRDYCKIASGGYHTIDNVVEAYDNQGIILIQALKDALERQLGKDYNELAAEVKDLEKELYRTGEGSPRFISLLYRIEDLLDSVACA